MSDQFETGPEHDPGQMSPTPAPEVELSPAAQRFESCRWRQVAEDGTPAHCTHRDVVTMAGVQSFSPDAWCTECGLYKVRRTPRKRPAPPPQDRYYY